MGNDYHFALELIDAIDVKIRKIMETIEDELHNSIQMIVAEKKL